MNYYIDRKRMGIAEIFSSMHTIFSSYNSMSAEETVRLMCKQKYRTRAKIAASINRGVSKMVDESGVDLEEYYGDEIKNLAENPVRADNLSELVPFMKWLMEIHRVNSLAVDRSGYSLNDAANQMGREAGEFLRCCSSNMMWQNITVTEEGDGLYMSIQEKFWGKAGLYFPRVRTSFEGTFPLIGTLFCVDYTYSLFYNGGYMFPEMILTALGSAILCTIIFEAFKIDVNASKTQKLKATAEANLASDGVADIPDDKTVVDNSEEKKDEV